MKSTDLLVNLLSYFPKYLGIKIKPNDNNFPSVPSAVKFVSPSFECGLVIFYC